MRHMPGKVDHIEQVAGQAHRLIEAGDLPGAQAVLRDALAGVSPEPVHATGGLAAAAVLYARVLSALDDPGTARQWAAFAHTASQRLYGPGDERTLQAASILAAVLHRVGAYSRAAHLYRDLVARLGTLDGVESPRALAARADLATVLHARGDCVTARAILDEAWATYRDRYGDSQPVGIKMLTRLGAMERDCGLVAQAQQRFTWAEALCRQNLPPGHRMIEQIDALARTPADPRHICADPLPPGDDDDDLAYATDYRRNDAADSGRSDAAAPGRNDAAAPGRNDATDYGRSDPEGYAEDGRGYPAEPSETYPTSGGHGYASDAETSHRRGTYGAEDRYDRGAAAWWPPEAEPPSDEPPDTEPADTEPGSTEPPRTRPPEPGKHEQFFVPQQRSTGSELSTQRTADVALRPPARSTDVVAPARHRRLEDTDRRDTRRRHELKLALIAVLAIIIVAVVTIATGVLIAQARSQRAHTQGQVPRQPTPSPAQVAPGAGGQSSAAPVASGPPTAVALHDGTASVTLTWKYPTGAEGPVILSAGRAGEARHAFQTLAAGTETFVVYGLPEGTDYCFTVAIAYSTDLVAMSAPVCTARRPVTASKSGSTG
jgi:hypothetical protein